MKRILNLLIYIFALALCLSACAPREYSPIAATTLPVYEFTARICEGTELTVSRLVTESVSCLHDYALNVDQVRAVEAAELIVISGAGMEEFMEDVLDGKPAIDASTGMELLEPEEHNHEHNHEEPSHEGHTHEEDPHIWLSPDYAAAMAQNICNGLIQRYPQYTETFTANLHLLNEEIEALQVYGDTQLADLSSRDLITFHDGFAYFAKSFDLEIVRAVEEESGAEASAAELIELIEEVEHHNLRAIFTETNGSTSAASVISRETGAAVYTLDMAMSGDSWFDAMYHNIDTIKEALK